MAYRFGSIYRNMNFLIKQLKTVLIVAATFVAFAALLSVTHVGFLNRATLVYPVSPWIQIGNVSGARISSFLDVSPSTAIFLCIDSRKFNENTGIANVVKKWSMEEPFIRDCNDKNLCTVHIIFYSDDRKTYSPEFRHSIWKIFYPNNESSAEQSDNVIHIIPNRQNEARTINDIMMTAYITGVDYFFLITSPQIEFGGRIGRTSQELIDEISNLRLRDLGAILFCKQTDPNLKSTVTGFLISKLHIEIFGEPFPFSNIPTLAVAFETLSNVYPSSMLKFLNLGSQLIFMAKSSLVKTFELPKEFLEDQQEILERFINALDSANDCLRCNLKRYDKVIVMMLYGSDPRYSIGALRNAQLLPIIFPGWRLWIYTELEPKGGKRLTPPVPKNIIDRIEELGAEFRYVDATTMVPKLWRFKVLEEREIEVFTIRDSDSRLTPRDATVVAEWLKTDKPFHCIRDHPSHSRLAINDGLWGGRTKQLREILGESLQEAIKSHLPGYVEDSSFLSNVLGPKVQDSQMLCHDSFTCTIFPASFAFPVVRKGHEYLGQKFDEHSISRTEDDNILKSRKPNGNCEPIYI